MKNLIALFSSAMFFFHPSAFAVVAVQGPNAQVSVVYADQNKIIARECADETVFNSSGATLSSILKTCAADDEAVIPVARFEADLINNYLSQAKMHGISAQNYNDDQAEHAKIEAFASQNCTTDWKTNGCTVLGDKLDRYNELTARIANYEAAECKAETRITQIQSPDFQLFNDGSELSQAFVVREVERDADCHTSDETYVFYPGKVLIFFKGSDQVESWDIGEHSTDKRILLTNQNDWTIQRTLKAQPDSTYLSSIVDGKFDDKGNYIVLKTTTAKTDACNHSYNPHRSAK